MCKPAKSEPAFRQRISPLSSGSEKNQHEIGLFMTYSSTPKMETVCSSETFVDFYRTSRRCIPEDRSEAESELLYDWQFTTS
jgi:hypothetical protein